MAVGGLKPNYRKRYERKPFDFELTPRHFQIMELVERFEKLSTRQIVAWFGSQRVCRELYDLFHNSWIDRLNAAEFFNYGDVYCKSTKGARLLARKRGTPIPRTDYSDFNKRYRPWRLPHDMLTSSTRFAIENAARKHPYLRVTYGNELRKAMPAGVRNRSDPFRLEATIFDFCDGYAEEVSTHADDIILITDVRALPALGAKLLFVEADCGTETVFHTNDANGFNASIIADKYAFYAAYARDKRHVDQFGVSRMQVLFPTSGAVERLENMILCNKEMTENGHGSRRLLFTHEQRLHELDVDILNAFAWINGQGKPSTIIDQETGKSVTT